MKYQLLAVTLTLLAILMLATATISGIVALTATPFLLYILGSALMRSVVPDLEVTRTLSESRVRPQERVAVTITIRNRGAAVRELTAVDHLPGGLVVVDGRPRVHSSLEAGAEITWSYSVTAGRGSYLFTGVTVTAAGDLPLRHDRLFVEAPDELVTLPDQRGLSRIPVAPRRTLVYSGTLPSRRGGEGTEFFDVAAVRAS